MLFNSFSFILFFTIITILYFVIPHRYRWILLWAGSYFFYMQSKAVLVFLLAGSTFVNFVFSHRIYRTKEKNRRRNLLRICMIIDFGLLFVFKYLIFIRHNLSLLLGVFGKTAFTSDLYIILPVGISFFTFQAAAYVIDVYRGEIKPERHYGIFSVFISFFPQLIAGPIERSKNLMPQFKKEHIFTWDNLMCGLKILALGYFKKVVIADRIAVLVDRVYADPVSFGGFALTLAAVLFAFQIYCDFSGYSDIALGCARILGFRLTRNFETPYTSASIIETWRRWHVTLSSWFADYVYIPLGGRGRSRGEKFRNKLITFALSGLWHGASWTYVMWGVVNGAFVVLHEILTPFRAWLCRALHISGVKPLLKVLGVIWSFSLMAFAFIFFRADTIREAFYVISRLFSDLPQWGSRQYIYTAFSGMGLNFTEIYILGGAVAFLIVSECLSGRQGVFNALEKRTYGERFAYYMIVIGAIMLTGVFYASGQFIYFQF